jgi:hypothetical protein
VSAARNGTGGATVDSPGVMRGKPFAVRPTCDAMRLPASAVVELQPPPGVTAGPSTQT